MRVFKKLTFKIKLIDSDSTQIEIVFDIYNNINTYIFLQKKQGRYM